MSVLSGGERNRLALAKLLLKPFNVLVMDEPTNHLDIQSKEILKQALKNFDGTLILVSHDREFLDGLANKVFEFRDGKVKEFLGGINEYLVERKAQGFREIEASSNRPKDGENLDVEVKKENELSQEEIKEQRRIKNRITKLEDEIAGFESEIASLEKKFETSHSDEDLKKYDELKLSLEDKMQEWEEWMEKI